MLVSQITGYKYNSFNNKKTEKSTYNTNVAFRGTATQANGEVLDLVKGIFALCDDKKALDSVASEMLDFKPKAKECVKIVKDEIFPLFQKNDISVGGLNVANTDKGLKVHMNGSYEYCFDKTSTDYKSGFSQRLLVSPLRGYFELIQFQNPNSPLKKTCCHIGDSSFSRTTLNVEQYADKSTWGVTDFRTDYL